MSGTKTTAIESTMINKAAQANEEEQHPHSAGGGSFKMDDDISKEAQAIISNRSEYYRKYGTSIYSPLQYYARVMRDSIGITSRLHGIIGLILIPINTVIIIITMILKVLILNPPFTSSIQSVIKFELRLPITFLPPLTFKEGHSKFYSVQAKLLEAQKGAPTASKFLAQDGVFYESLVMLGLRFPLFSVPSSGVNFTTEDEDQVIGHFPLWCLHPFTGFVFFQRHPETNQIYVCAEFSCWGILRPVYRWMCFNIFDRYLKETDARSEDDRVFKVESAAEEWNDNDNSISKV